MNNQRRSDSSEIVLRKISRDDLLEVSQVHLSSFPDTALTKLGAEAVKRYYLWQLIGPHKKVRAVAAFIDDNCVGFSFSGAFNGSTSGFLNHNKFFLTKEVLKRPWLLSNPLLTDRIIRSIKLINSVTKKRVASVKEIANEGIQSCGILAIGVSANHQKLGIGKMLMQDAEEEAIKYGFRVMKLTVHPSNEKAVKSYEKLNYQKSLQDSSWKGLMIKHLE